MPLTMLNVESSATSQAAHARCEGARDGTGDSAIGVGGENGDGCSRREGQCGGSRIDGVGGGGGEGAP